MYKLIPSNDVHVKKIMQSDSPSGRTGHPKTKVVVSDSTFPSWLSPRKIPEIWIDSFRRYWWSKNPAIGLVENWNWPHSNKSGNIRCYLCLMTIFMQKVLDNDEILMIKESCIWYDERHTWPDPIKNGRLRSYLSLMIIFMQKIYHIYWFFPKILIIKESCNLIGQETHPARPKVVVSGTAFLDYLRTKNLRYQLIPSRYTDNLRILQSDWLRAF